MRDLLLKANAFVLPSAIENSPNSLGEAMLMGVPSVASCVGGVQDLVKDRVDGFIYPYNEPYMMAHYVMQLFEDTDIATRMSEKARENAANVYSRAKNADDLISIYRDITGLV